MNKFHIGDKVRFGSGKVVYTVAGVNEDGTYQLIGQKSSRPGAGHRLTLVEAAPVDRPEKDRGHQTSSYGRSILSALQSKAHVFAGAVFPAKRRAKNRVAKASRKANRT